MSFKSVGESDKMYLILGCIIEETTSYSGNDIEIGNGQTHFAEVENQAACARLSFSTAGSLFWTYQPSTSRCWVKTSKSGREADSAAVSGNRECGRQAGKSMHYG